MPALVAVLLIPVASLLPGWLITRQFGRGRLSLPLVFAALSLGLSVMGWSALLLAEFGRFSIGLLALVWTLLVIGLLAIDVWRGRTGNRPLPLPDDIGIAPSSILRLPGWAESVFLILWSVAAGWLFFRPHEYVLGAADAGVYISLGSSIAREGSILIQDETLANLDAGLFPALLRTLPPGQVAPYYLLPGYYVIGEPAGEITPQFYPLYPVWLAVASGLVSQTATDASAAIPDTVRAMLLLNGLWAMLGALAVYLIVRQFAGWEIAALALMALSITALQVWFARYPTTEVLTQYALWGGVYALGMWLGGERPGALWALLAGVSLGIVYLVRVDMLVLLPVLGLLAFWLVAGGRRTGVEPRTIAWFLIPLGLLIGHSFVHAWWQSRPYFVVHSGLGLNLLQVNWAIWVVAAIAAIAFLYLLRRAGPQFASQYDRYRDYAILALIGVTLVVAIYGWFIRPMTGQTVMRQELFSQIEVPLTDHENWRRLGWYLSPVGIWLGVAGTIVLIRRMDRRTAMALAIGSLFAVFYLWSLRANPHQVYAMRRYVPAVVPYFTIAAAAFIGWLAGRREVWAKWIAGILAALWLGGLVWSARGFVTQVDHAGLMDKVHGLNAIFAPDSVLLFNDGALIGNGDFFGTPLKFIYGHDVFAIRDAGLVPDTRLVDAIEIWHNSGRAVYWIGDPQWLAEQGMTFTDQTYVINSRRLEDTYEHKPYQILQDEWTLRVARIEPLP